MVSQIGVQRAPLLSQIAQEVTKLEREWVEAALSRDAVALDHLLADNFLVTSPFGKLNKAQCIEEINRGEMAFESISREDAIVRDYGDEAVVSGIVKVRGRYKGRDISGHYRYRYSEAYVKCPGRWQLLTGQVNRISYEWP